MCFWCICHGRRRRRRRNKFWNWPDPYLRWKLWGPSHGKEMVPKTESVCHPCAIRVPGCNLAAILIFFVRLFISIVDPIVLNKWAIVSTSLTIGTLVITIFLLVNIVEANMGSVAFLDPEIKTVPDIFLPPLISSYCILFEIIL